MKILDVKKWFKNTYPNHVTSGGYSEPNERCRKWLLIASPEIDATRYKGIFFAESIKLVSWAENHSHAVWTNQTMEQEAREFLPKWLANADTADDRTSLPDSYIYKILEPYLLTFINEGWINIWCPNCNNYHVTVNTSDYAHNKYGPISQWIAEWQCPNGHVLHHEAHEVRWIIR